MNEFPDELLRAMRILNLNEEELYFYSNSVEMISIRNEILALETLLNLFRDRMVALHEAIEVNVLPLALSPFYELIMTYPCVYRSRRVALTH